MCILSDDKIVCFDIIVYRYKLLLIYNYEAPYFYKRSILHSVTTKQVRHQEIRQYNTRHASLFDMQPLRQLTLFEKEPSYKGATYYNDSPEQLKLKSRNISRIS